MRVLIINTVSDRSEVTLKRGLRAMGHEIEVICDPRDPSAVQLNTEGIPTTQLSFRSRLDLGAIKHLHRRFRERHYDSVYAITSRALTASILAFPPKTTRIVTYRGTMGHLSYWSPASRFAHLSSRVNCIVCNCKAVRDHLFDLGVPESRLSVVYKGHLVEWHDQQPGATRTELGIGTDEFVVGCIANARPVKGINYLVQAIALIPKELKVRLVLIGDLSGSKLLHSINELGIADQVSLLGYRKDAGTLAKICDATVMASVDREGVPRAVVESMAQSVPVIVTDVGGMPELVVADESGMVAPPRNSRALAEAIQKLALDKELAKRLGKNGRARIASQFTCEAYIKRMEEILRGN